MFEIAIQLHTALQNLLKMETPKYINKKMDNVTY